MWPGPTVPRPSSGGPRRAPIPYKKDKKTVKVPARPEPGISPSRVGGAPPFAPLMTAGDLKRLGEELV